MLLSEKIIAWIQSWFAENGRKTAVIGISGGKDSAVVAALCARALGPENVVGVIMPNGSNMSWEDKQDAMQVIQELGIRHYNVELWEPYTWLCSAIFAGTRKEVSPGAKINIAPRLRMTVLYAIAQTLSETEEAHACVVGTGNRAEAEVGYTTKWGDSACDMNPIRDLWVDEVLQVGDELGYFPNLVHKAPADGLCGQTDEERLGFTYAQVREVLELDGTESLAVVKAIMNRNRASKHKRDPIPYFRKH